MTIAFIIARFALGFYWLQVAYSHLFKSADLVGYAQMKGVPTPRAAVLGTGVLALFGGLSILLGIWTTVGIVVLIVFLLGTAFKMHAFWNDTDQNQRTANVVNFYKNIALAAAILGLIAVATPWSYAI